LIARHEDRNSNGFDVCAPATGGHAPLGGACLLRSKTMKKTTSMMIAASAIVAAAPDNAKFFETR
jgi:hypothetical protein